MTGNDIIKCASKYANKQYGKHVNKFTKHFAGKYGIKKSGYIPAGWCTMFVGYIYDECGIFNNIPSKAVNHWWNVQKLYKYNKAKGKVVKLKDAQPGAIAYKIVGKTKPGHSCIFIKTDGKYVWTIDGNVSNSRVKVRKKKASLYMGFTNPVLPKEVKKEESKYTIGKTYAIKEPMHVRVAPSSAADLVPEAKWTVGARKHRTEEGLLAKGTKVTVKGVKQVGKATWIRIPSGWVCAIGSRGKIFIS